MSSRAIAAHQTEPAAGIELRGVTKWFLRGQQQIQALAEVDLTIDEGEFVTLIGPSGCGKTTLLRMVGGLLDTTEGVVSVAGVSPHQARRAKLMGLVPQTPALMPWRSVRRNVMLLAEVNKRRAAHAPLSEAEAEELLRTVGLGQFLDLLPNQLSGGMQQRVALVRGFVLGAPVLLMDEPFSALDELTRADMRYLLLDLWTRASKTVFFVTHSIPEAVILSDRVVVLANGPGRVIAVENIELERPREQSMEDGDQFHRHLANIRRALREGSGR